MAIMKEFREFAVRGLNRMKRREEEAAPVATPPTPEIPEAIILLREIRDSLKPKA
ncbi:hypothetical protein [Alloalcanivorax marinus]|uniref:hypothetical protein n=1 Tax=Alloalcanivorax marinus TaxID=1177169 RepID=UPI00193455A7|nr:hypothetical protein [Alloalcanivorax marinus]MBL7251048.1 hypothetical protein [Alloalcanivorax marinus]